MNLSVPSSQGIGERERMGFKFTMSVILFIYFIKEYHAACGPCGTISPRDIYMYICVCVCVCVCLCVCMRACVCVHPR